MREASNQIRPKALSRGDRVALVAPASPYDDHALAAAMDILQSWELVPEAPSVFSRQRFLAGTDTERGDALTHAFEREDVAAIMAVRGGYGSARLLNRFDPAVAAAHPKIFLGYSDLSILLSRLRREAGLVCFHGPMATSDLPRLGPDDLERFRRFLFAEEGWWAGQGLVCRVSGSGTGRLVGGCLSVLTTTIGTPYEIDTRGNVLFLEDVNEPPYRIDRNLTHLLHARKLEDVAAVVLGRFHECDPPDASGQCAEIFEDFFGRLGIPTVSGFDSGHHSGGAVVPMGCQVRVEAETGIVELLEPVFGNRAPISTASRDLARIAAASLRRGPGSMMR
jgi:muramoyltetrapeptide carboxypeptidase